MTVHWAVLLVVSLQQGGFVPAPGAVATVAGPGLCAGTGVVNAASSAVRSIAVDGSGTVSFTTGPVNAGALARVDADGRARLVPTGVVAGGDVALAPDRSGGVYLGADASVVGVSATDAVAVVAGDPKRVGQGGPPGDGDGGPSAVARFGKLVGMATDESGNLYVAEQAGDGNPAIRIRFLNRGAEPVTFYPGTAQALVVGPGHIDTIAGRGGAEHHAAGFALGSVLPGASAALAAAPARLYVGIEGTSRSGAGPSVMVVNTGGTHLQDLGVSVAAGGIATVAGGGTAGFGGDGGPAVGASFSRLSGLTTDDAGGLLVADETNHRIRKIDARGTITTLAGTGAVGPTAGGFNGNDRPATHARLNHPSGVATGPGGRVYIADRQNDQIRYLDTSGLIRAARGNGIGLAWDCAPEESSPPGTRAIASPPVPARLLGIAADGEGNLYMASESLQQVKKRDAGGTITIVAGGRPGGPPCPEGPVCPSDEGMPAADARLKRPAGLAVSPQGGLYIFDVGDARLRFVNLGSRPRRVHGVTVSPGTIRTVAGTGTPGGGGDGGPALAAELTGQPYSSVVADRRGNVFLTDRSDRPGTEAGRVRRIDAEGVITTVVRGPADADPSGCCYSPAGLAVDPAGNLYVSDIFDRARRVWFVNLGTSPASAHGRTVAPGGRELVAGTGEAGFGGDGGPAVDAQFETPVSLALDRRGILYVADLTENTVRQVDGAGQIATVLGTGSRGFNGDGLKGPLTSLAFPTSVAVDRCDNLLVADQANDRVRRLELTESCPGAARPGLGGSQPSLPLGVLAAVAVVLAGAVGVVRMRKRPEPADYTGRTRNSWSP